MHDNNLNPVRNFISNGIKKRIMRKVYAIWFFRKLTSPLGIELLIFALFSACVLWHESPFNIMRNALNSSDSMVSLPSFFLNNFMVTDLISQILTAGTLIAAVTIIITLTLILPKKESFTSLPL